jgi:hypothetical protein
MQHANPHSPPTPNQQLGEFLRQLRWLVLDEADNVRQQLFQIWSRPLATRVAEGHAIEGVRVVQVEPSGVITLACDRNASRFREGDVLLLNRGDPFAGPQLLVTLELDEVWRLRNTSGVALEQGPVTITSDGRYLGEGAEFAQLLDQQERLRKNLGALGTSERESALRNRLLDDLETSEERRRAIAAARRELDQQDFGRQTRQQAVLNELFGGA